MASNTGEGEFGFQIAPMLDVLFVLLLFFMVSAGIQKRETAISVPLPGGPGAKVPVELTISADGQVAFNGVAEDGPADHRLPETAARLKAILADAPERPIMISPVPSARHQRVVDVLNVCKLVGVKNIMFGSPLE